MSYFLLNQEAVLLSGRSLRSKVKNPKDRYNLTSLFPEHTNTHTRTIHCPQSTVCSHTASQLLRLINTLCNAHSHSDGFLVCALMFWRHKCGWGVINTAVSGGSSFLPSSQLRIRNAHLELLSFKRHPVFQFLCCFCTAAEFGTKPRPGLTCLKVQPVINRG